MRKVIVLDCDLTLWSHPDVSSLKPPFKVERRDLIVDANGEEVKLNRGALWFLHYVKLRGHKLVIASWNEPKNVIELLKLFKVLDLVDLVLVEPHPHKDFMLERIMYYFKVTPSQVILVDDDITVHTLVLKRFKEVKTILYGVDVEDFFDLYMMLKSELGEARKVYLSLPIIGHEDFLFRKRYFEVVERLGVEILSKWIIKGDLGKKPDEVFIRDLKHLDKAEALIADVTYPSHGVGAEIMYAFLKRKPLIVTFKEGAKVSYMILGMPGVKIVKYKTLEDLENGLWREILRVFAC